MKASNQKNLFMHREDLSCMDNRDESYTMLELEEIT